MRIAQFQGLRNSRALKSQRNASDLAISRAKLSGYDSMGNFDDPKTSDFCSAMCIAEDILCDAMHFAAICALAAEIRCDTDHDARKYLVFPFLGWGKSSGSVQVRACLLSGGLTGRTCSQRNQSISQPFRLFLELHNSTSFFA